MILDYGVYTYLMPLREGRTITVGRLGTDYYPPGWYCYAGSAQGGVHKRLKAHCNNDKRPHFNVDHLRRHADISEVWYTYGPGYLECEYAQTLASMTGALRTVHKFGARDCTRCFAHMVRFEHRPFPSAFRDALARWTDMRLQVLVEFIAPYTDDPLMLGTRNVTPLLTAYDRGRRWLERQRWAFEEQQQLAMIGEVAEEMNVPASTLRKDIQLADAVDRIVANCGEKAFHVLFDPARPQARHAILRLGEATKRNQRSRINGVLRGRCRSVRPAARTPH